ncbi:transmembrane 7 superfamily member 3-like [Physella acuta]|uniref:transmembrane 7 superfamily member 3-like n=1 Tax=Physella acuta TaxID=109671 RepID=UPI0027DAB5AA|nr:transmembrane 7 superfamily member 3-like [Physella acuta]
MKLFDNRMHNFCVIFVAGIFLLSSPSATLAEGELVLDSSISVITILANKTTTVWLRSPFYGFSYITFQFHTQISNLSLSSEPSFGSDTTKTGTSVGILTILQPKQDNVTLYMRVSGPDNVTAVALMDFHDSNDPLPGGCNQVFNLPIDPSIVLLTKPYRTDVWFQWANVAVGQGLPLPDCENKIVQSNLTYEVYVYYLAQGDQSEHEFINSVKKMIDPVNIKKYGSKVVSTRDGPSAKSILSVMSQANQGALYAVVVTRQDTGRSAAYTTAVSYGCSFEKEECTTQTSIEEIFWSIAVGVFGIFLLLVGHQFFKTTQFVFGYIFTALLIYILLSIPHSYEDSIKIPVSLGLGVVGGLLWLAFWYFIQFPIISVFLAGLCSGYLIASVVFFTPLANIDWWLTELNYGMGFTCVILIFTVGLMAFTKVLSILSCALVGAFMLLLSIAIPFQSSLKLIFLNSIYHQTQSNYLDVKVVFPYYTLDIVLTVLWPVLVLASFCLQWRQAKGKPAFNVWRRGSHTLEQVPNQYSYDAEDEERNNTSTGSSVADERRKLLGSGGRAYGTADENSQGSSQGQREKNLLT